MKVYIVEAVGYEEQEVVAAYSSVSEAQKHVDAANKELEEIVKKYTQGRNYEKFYNAIDNSKLIAGRSWARVFEYEEIEVKEKFEE